jgi:hypothetical protein
LRDDVELLLQSLSDILTRKLSIIRAIRAEETNCRYYLKSGDTERLAFSINHCSGFAAEADVLDYDAAAARGALVRSLGITGDRLVPFLRSSGEPAATALSSLIAVLDGEIRALKPDHDRMLDDMENRYREMERERRSLAALGRVLERGEIKDPRDSSS